jgi:hypothetical protein
MAFVIENEVAEPTEQTPALPHEEIVGQERVSSNDENVTMGMRPSRQLKESTLKLLRTDLGAAPDAAKPEGAAKPADVAATPAATDDAAKAKPADASAKPEEPHPDTVRATRLAEHNAKLVAELEAARKQSHRSGPSEREKTLDEIEGLIVTNPIAAHRKLMAMAMGVPEDSKDIDAHEQFLESELTSKRIGVPLTEESEAARKAARTLVAIQREMRARKAEETTKAAAPPVDPDEAVATEKSSIIGNRLAASKHAEKYPLLMAWSEGVHGAKPERLLWTIIDHGFKTGEFDRSTPDDQLIDAASKRIETYYQDLLSKAPKTGTAQPEPIASTDGKNADSPGKQVGTISNAVASVAPATLPENKAPDKQTYRTEREKRLAVIRKHSVA